MSLVLNGNAPAFSAYRGSNQSIATATWTKVQADTEEFDTNSNYDNATNYRFTPTVAGYYQVNGQVKLSGSAGTAIASIYKNGAEFKRGAQSGIAAQSGQAMTVGTLVYLNGSTDYIEMYAYQNSGSSLLIEYGANTANYFQACLVRGT